MPGTQGAEMELKPCPFCGQPITKKPYTRPDVGSRIRQGVIVCNCGVEKYSNNFAGYYIPIVERLADLIDIPTCVMTDVGGDFENSFQCSNCMSEFDMPDFDRYPYKRCPECGAVVLNAD